MVPKLRLHKLALPVLLAGAFAGGAPRAFAESVSPFIDAVRTDLDEESAGKAPPTAPGSFLKEEQEKLRRESDSDGETPQGSYTETMKQTLEAQPSPSATEGETWLQRKQRELRAQDSSGKESTISRIQADRDEIHGKKDENVRYAVSFHMAATTGREVSTAGGAGTGRAFADVYTREMFLPMGFSGEYQALRWSGVFSLGFGPSFDVSSHRGLGVFKVDLGDFGNESQVDFRFVTLATMLNAVLRLDLIPVIQPWISGGGGALLYRESRNDDGAAHQGYSLGSRIAAGVNIRLDGLMDSSSWDTISELGLNHIYLSLMVARIGAAGDQLRVSQQSVFGGFTYEY